MAALFAWAMLVQYNDPDPVGWMLVYGVAAVASARAAAARGGWWLSVAVGAVALGWATALLPRVLATPPELAEVFRYQMRMEGVEETRELLGLALVAAWMTVLTIVTWPKRAPRSL